MFRAEHTIPRDDPDPLNRAHPIPICLHTREDCNSIDRPLLIFLPVNPAYELNPNDPTICVLVTWMTPSSELNGEIMLYNATTGAFIEKVGDSMGLPALKDSDVQFLDTDDGPDWEIHVSNYDADGNSIVSVFDYL